MEIAQCRGIVDRQNEQKLIPSPCICMHDNYFITAMLDQLKDLSTIKYSPVGSSSHKLEVDTFVMFMDYLYECEKGNNNNFM